MNSPTPLQPTSTFRYATRGALQWRLLLLWAVAMLLPTLLMVWPFWQTLSGQLDYNLHSAAWARQLDATVIADLMGKLTESGAAISQAGLLGVILTLLLSPWFTAAVTGAARAERPPGLVKLIQLGMQDYGRMARMLLWAVVPLGLMGALAAGGFAMVDKMAKKAVLESDFEWLSLAVTILAAVLMLLAHLTLDAGRAQLAVYPRRTSAVKAWWRGCKLIKARWAASIGFYLAITVVGVGVALAITALRIALPQLGVVWLALGLMLAELAVLAVGWVRIARLLALIDLSQR